MCLWLCDPLDCIFQEQMVKKYGNNDEKVIFHKIAVWSRVSVGDKTKKAKSTTIQCTSSKTLLDVAIGVLL